MVATDDAGAAVWLIRSPEGPRPEHLAVLSAQERARCLRFRGQERQARYAAGRALLRGVLGETLGLAPAEVPIVIGDKRRPQLASAPGEPASPLDFNLSSTPGFVACALARGARVGVDIEHPGRTLDMESLAENVFTEAERHWWSCSKNPARDFCRLWALKESVAKADGEGIGLPFGEMTLMPDERGGLMIDLSAMNERSGHWNILELDTAIPAALALRWTGTGRGGIELSPGWPAGELFDAVPLKAGASSP